MTDRSEYLQFDASCWLRTENALDAKPLIRDPDAPGRSIYANLSKSIGVLGRRHRGENGDYWFNVENQHCQHLERYSSSYIAFACGEDGSPPIVLVERAHLEAFFTQVSLTQRPKSIQHNIVLSRAGSSWTIKLVGGDRVHLTAREL